MFQCNSKKKKKKKEKKETTQNDIVLGMYGEQYLLHCVRLPISYFS
jgi:hypothetical protein